MGTSALTVRRNVRLVLGLQGSVLVARLGSLRMEMGSA